MNRELIARKIAEKNFYFTKEEFHNITDNHIEVSYTHDNPRGHINLIILMEELAELSQETSKAVRENPNYIGIVEEIADVIISIDHLVNICNISEKDIMNTIGLKLKKVKYITDNPETTKEEVEAYLESL